MKAERYAIKKISWKQDFPILCGENRGKPLVYLDSASSAQKPKIVIDKLAHFYMHDYANVHRGIYELSERATKQYEATRKLVQHFIHAKSLTEIIFVSSTTEGINLVAQSLGRMHWQADDEVIVSGMEHHSNIVPWLLLQKQIGIKLRVIPVTDDGALDMTVYPTLFSAKTKLVAVSHASNVMGTINPIAEITQIAHLHEVPVLVDGAQAVPHLQVNVAALDCDFYVFSSHKLYGPSGVGILYVKQKWLEQMTPYQGGGGMIETVSFKDVTFAPSPQVFEAGTPPIAEVIGMGEAIKYLQKIGMENVLAHEARVQTYAAQQLLSVARLRMIGKSTPKVGVFSFVFDHIHAHDLATILDHEGIAVRAGHHCAMPLMERFDIPATVRASLGLYTEEADIDALIQALELAKRLFS